MVVKIGEFDGGDGDGTWFHRGETMKRSTKVINYHVKHYPIGQREFGY